MHAWDSLRRPIWLFDPDGFFGVYANPSALELWGAKSLDELLQRDFSNLSPAVRARTERLVRSTAGGGSVRERWTFYPQGKPATVDTTISTHVLPDGRAVLLFEASPAEIDIEERRAVEALRHTSTMVTLFDLKGAQIFANPASFSAYGASAPGFAARFGDEDAGRRLLERAHVGEAVGDVAEMVTRDGPRHHFVETRLVLDPASGEPGVLLNEVDVTLRVEAERARSAAEQRAAMAEARQAFLMEMSHELRTPLNAVIGFSNLLRAGGLAREHTEQAQRIYAAGQRLSEVVEEMIGLGADVDAPPPMQMSPGPDVGEAEDDAPRVPVRVLYVDDNESNRMLVKAILASQGIECRLAEDGQEGLDAARGGGFDVILMDIQMPVMNGIDATRAIRRLQGAPGDAPIVAVSANTQPHELVSYDAAGMDDVVAKPINAVELLGKVMGWGVAGRSDAVDDAA
jgi:CheY-like chemotaxis protein/signal transduction histidine kinase